MYIQVMTFEQAEKWEFNPFDLTKVCTQAYTRTPIMHVIQMLSLLQRFGLTRISH